MLLVITEKPSAARSIAAVLNATERRDDPSRAGSFFIGGNYIISWCAGHLLELAAPEVYGEQYAKWRYADLPIIPESWKHVPAKSESKQKQLKIVTDLMNRTDVDCVINACDAGREGELIFRLVYEYAKCNKPVKRFWVSSMEDAAIRVGFNNLKDGAEYDKLSAAASCRECADWACGLNATRLFSVLYGQTLNTGRVQSPTLAMLVKRESDIANFVKEPFYTPTLDLSGVMASGVKIKDKSAADAIAAECSGQSAMVTNIERVEKTAMPPKLYDLTGLQRDSNRLLGYTAQQTLDYTQSLYEKSLLSYPRSDSRHITSDMCGTVLKILGDIGFTPDVDRLVGTVSDHHAIIPTLESRNADISAMSSGEREVFELVRKRLIAAVSPKHVYEAVTVTFDCGGNTFTARGKTVITQGWTSVTLDPNSATGGDDEKDEHILPELSKGQTFDSVKITVKEGFTTPPKRYTEDTLLSAMNNVGQRDDMPDTPECRGLGTPATRAAVIEKIIKAGFVERQKRSLIPTDKGKNLIAVLPDTLTSPTLTAEWENRLKQVESGELSERDFMDGIAEFIRSVVAENTAPMPEYANLFGGKKSDSPVLGNCPRCGSAVREAAKGFFCDSHSCGFKLWRDSKFWTAKKKPLTAEIVTALLADGRVALRNLYSDKTGKTYDATVIMDDNGGKFVNFKLKFL